MRRHIATITDVAERHLCLGCGVCAFAQPDDISMVDDLRTGRRPVVRDGADTAKALSWCPGVEMGHPDDVDPQVNLELLEGWGPVLEVWEGHAADPEIRHLGSSGGAATALSHYGQAAAGMAGTLHIKQRTDVPILNETVLSTGRDDLIAATGSRYAPASPCDGLQLAVDAANPVVFVGKPCDVAATCAARRDHDALDEKLGVTIAIFCAGAPSTQGTLAMIEAMGGARLEDVGPIRYRGKGWPGRAEVQLHDGQTLETMSYAESWGGVLERHRPWRCRLCIDHTGEFADISVGDPWYREPQPGEVGSSLIVARTQRGREFVQAAIEAGFLDAAPVPHERLPQSQPNLLQTRGAVFGRLWASRLVGAPAPVYRNMPTGRHWMRELSTVMKLRSFSGTFKRIFTRRLHRRVPVEPATALDPTQRKP